MSDAGLIVGLAFCSIGVVLIGLAVPLISRRVPMNGLYGVRIAKSFSSQENWFAINAYGGRVLAVVGAVHVVLGIVLVTFPPSSESASLLVAFAPVPIVLLSLVPILRFARRLP